MTAAGGAGLRGPPRPPFSVTPPSRALLFALPLQWVNVASARRIGRILRAYPWQQYPCSFLHLGNHMVCPVLRTGDEQEGDVVLEPRTFKSDLRSRMTDHPDRVWLAGDSRFGGALSPVGGALPERYVRSKRTNRPEAAPGGDARAKRSGATGRAF